MYRKCAWFVCLFSSPQWDSNLHLQIADAKNQSSPNFIGPTIILFCFSFTIKLHMKYWDDIDWFFTTEMYGSIIEHSLAHFKSPSHALLTCRNGNHMYHKGLDCDSASLLPFKPLAKFLLRTLRRIGFRPLGFWPWQWFWSWEEREKRRLICNIIIESLESMRTSIKLSSKMCTVLKMGW